MPISTSGAVGAPLTVHGSWVTDVSPDALPENVSPDNQEIVYAAGEHGSRPGLEIVAGITFPAVGGVTPTAVYGKSFVTPALDIQNLYFDSAGRLWMEDFTNSPGTLTLLLQSTPGSYCKSITKFGREYIAISDGLHGTEVPLQWDGTLLRRVTQDGPGTPPVVQVVSSPSVAVAATATSYPITNAIFTGGSSLLYNLTTPQFAVTVGLSVTVSGNSVAAYNISGTVTGIQINAGGQTIAFSLSYLGANFGIGTGGNATTSIGSLSRTNNLLTVNTASPHGLQVGYQAQLQGNGSLTVGTSITSIVINNENNAGLATVTTLTPHGLSPMQDVTIVGVQPVAVGGATNWSGLRSGGTTTLTCTGNHGLVLGGVVQTTGSSDKSLNTNVTIALVPSPTQIVFYQAIDADITTAITGITVSLTWPIPDQTIAPTYFEIQACPTTTTFQVQVTYCDGTWNTGTVGFPWDGTFYVSSTPSATSFICQQYGPNGITSSVTGTVTPFGQLGVGLHLVSVAYLTDQGAITKPSPFATFICNGGQYVLVSGIPIGPANIVARILLFTGSQPDVPGELPPFFYIPVTPMLEGQIVGTATQINDNTTTAVLLDFSDSTLYAAIGASIPGNNLANQIVLDGALGFRTYLSQLIAYGQRNTINNLLNMSFQGGYVSNNNQPSGWNISTGHVSLVHVGFQDWLLMNVPAGNTPSVPLTQSFYQDCYGAPIAESNTLYTFRCWCGGATNPSVLHATIYSLSTGFSSTMTINVSSNEGFQQGNFNLKTPLNIPNDFMVQIYSTSLLGGSLFLHDCSIFPTENPYTDTVSFVSYVNNPEGFDSDTGKTGPQGTAKIMDFAIVRGALCCLTQAPIGKLHSTNGSAVTGPSGWEWETIAGECGVLSAFTLTTSQADDATEAGGADWMAWASDAGVMIYGGGLPEKISQEIQPNWNDPTKTNTAVQINMAAALTVWGLNDPVSRLLMFGVPIGDAATPNQIYVLNYEHLGSSQAIANSPPFHPSFAGKLIATDNSRKWTHWIRPMNGAARMYRSAGELTNVFFGGNGQTLGAAPGYGHIYTLNPSKFTDDDFGQIYPYYVTYFFVDPERRQMMQLKGGRLLLAYILAQIQPQSGDTNSQVTLTYYGDNLANPWPLTTTRILTPNFYKDRNFGGGMAQGERIAIKIASSPVAGTDNSYVCSRFEAFFRNARLLISGVNQ
jgi:hypothetical protein